MTEARTALGGGAVEHGGREDDQRLRSVAEAIDLLRPAGTSLTVLDVGGAAGLGDLLASTEVVAADRTELERLAAQRDGARLSLPDGAHDYVVGVDTYGSVADDARDHYLAELRRVARRGVLIAAPFDSPALRDAQRMARDLRVKLEPGNGEVVEEGLPRIDSAREFFERQGDRVVVLGDGQLALWLFSACFPVYGSSLDEPFVELAQRIGTLWEELLAGRSEGPSYRQLLVCLRSAEEADLARLSAETPGIEGAALSSSLLTTLAAILPLGAQVQVLQRQTADYERRFLAQEGALARRQAQIQDLSRRLAEAITLLEGEREERERIQAEMDRIAHTRAWRAIALQYRVRKRVWAFLTAPFRAIARRSGRVSEED